MNSLNSYRVNENIRRNSFEVTGVEYEYEETSSYGEVRRYQVNVERRDYERLAAQQRYSTLPFDKFLKVLRPFMMGQYAQDDIPEAFRLLDSDHSGTIDIGELAAFMPAIIPNSNPYMLLHHVQKVDKNGDCKLSYLEFNNLIKRGIGRDIAIGKL